MGGWKEKEKFVYLVITDGRIREYLVFQNDVSWNSYRTDAT